MTWREWHDVVLVFCLGFWTLGSAWRLIRWRRVRRYGDTRITVRVKP